jgi:hypothetical protein
MGSRHKPRFTSATGDALNPGILDDLGNPAPTPHGIYVYNDIYLDIADSRSFKQAIAASIEAIFILLGESNTALRQDPISWDKLHKLLIAPTNRILGLVLDLYSITVGTPLEFISATIALLSSTWGPHCRIFKVREAEELAGRLNHIALGAPLLKYLLAATSTLL